MTSRLCCCCSGESAAAAFKDLNKLSRSFKDQLAYPLIAAAREGKHSYTCYRVRSQNFSSSFKLFQHLTAVGNDMFM